MYFSPTPDRDRKGRSGKCGHDMAEFTIRAITREEITASAKIILEAFNQVAADYGFQPDTDDSRLLSRLEEDFDLGVKLIGAFSESEQVGFAEIDAKDEEVFEVRQLCVLPAYQRQGCGQALLDYAVSQIRSTGGVAVVCAVIEGKQWLKDWLSKNGFWEEVSGQPEGLPCRVSLLQKDLPPQPGSCDSCGAADGCGSCGGCH